MHLAAGQMNFDERRAAHRFDVARKRRAEIVSVEHAHTMDGRRIRRERKISVAQYAREAPVISAGGYPRRGITEGEWRLASRAQVRTREAGIPPMSNQGANDPAMSVQA